jgi:hypothetical protein
MSENYRQRLSRSFALPCDIEDEDEFEDEDEHEHEEN